MSKENGNGPVYAAAAVVIVLIVVLGVIFSGVLRSPPSATTTVPATTITAQGGTLSMVSVSASGSAMGLPSMATVEVFVNATGNSANTATANFSSKLSTFNSTVYSYIGGNMSLIKTQYYSVAKVYSNNSLSSGVYQAEEYITVTLPQISKLNSFLENVTGVPGLQVQDVSAILSVPQITQLRQQALQSAIANATSQAKAIIGNATIVNSNVSVGSYFAYPEPLFAAANGGPALAPKTSPLYYNGTSSVQEQIQATFYYRK